ncbi:MAG: hypothetical protein JWN41_1036, partial [Thermoleophilia bacterium]|nr:hypothetical protein [Thermoleophilia bacterium]
MMVAALLGGVAHEFGTARAQTLAAAVPQRLAELLERRRVRVAHERRGEGGSLRVRVARDDIRLAPVVPDISAVHAEIDHRAQVGGFRVRIDGEACAACLRVGTRHALSTGGDADRDGAGVGVHGSAEASVQFAAVAAQIGARAEHTIGFGFAPDLGVAVLQGRARGIVGAEAAGVAKVRVGAHAQALELSGSAMAGAAAHAEARVGI